MPDARFDRLFPAALADFLRASSQRDFEAAYPRSTWLLVHLDPNAPELRTGLAAVERADSTTLQPSLSVLGYDTVVHDLDTRGASLMGAAAFDAISLRRLVERHDLFAIPLRKRAGDAYADRISVGRARNKDVVLRQESVSKFHAWFEMDDDQRFYLADAGSVNGTRVEGRLLPPRELAPVSAGAPLDFGSVRAVLCSGETLWQAAHSAPPR